MFTDKYAISKFKELIDQFKIKTVIETGTYQADSTIRFADYVDIVYSIEINKSYYDEAKRRVFENGKIKLLLGNSPEVLTELSKKSIPTPICFYLDAHWGEYWPVKDEIRAIKLFPPSIIIIHDFKVPGKPFGYDSYNGQDLDFDFVKDDLAFVNPQYTIFYNEEAEGNNRGILYALPLLKPFEWDDIQITYIKRLIDELGIRNFFETGTYMGQTSLYFAGNGLKVQTVEIDKEKYENCLQRFQGKDITIVNTSGEVGIREYLKGEYADTLFYLDAHGHGYETSKRYGSLCEELTQLLMLPKVLVIVHNIKAPSQPEKTYSPEVNEEFNKVRIPKGTTMIFPKYPIIGYSYGIINRGYPLIKDSNFSFLEL